MDKEKILNTSKKILQLYKDGKLGGDFMPEDSNPRLNKLSEENLLYLTLPMALNYQRNSYKLWESALQTWEDEDTRCVFNPSIVNNLPIEELREKLTKYKVALQPNKQPIIWQTICRTIIKLKSLIDFFQINDFDIGKIKNYIVSHKKDFPYLSGTKILNYWLYVLTNYTDFKFKGREFISIAPDTHVIQASLKLGIIEENELTKNNIREIVSDRWLKILHDTDILPIDLHTPFWLWSRSGFKIQI